jgi:hypothetical protein
VLGACVYDPDDGASCTEGGLPGTCDDQGSCIGLCDGVDCTSSNQCVQDGSCDDQTGDCISGANVADGTTCDAAGLPGECDTGMCVATCTPTPNVMVTLPTSGLPTPTYDDMANGFSLSAADCDSRPKCNVTFSFRGVGTDAYGGILAINPNDSLLLEFFDGDGNPGTVTDLQILLFNGGVGGIVEISVDGSTMPFSQAVTPGDVIDLTGTTAHDVQVTLTDDNPSSRIFWQELAYDHDCL